MLRKRIRIQPSSPGKVVCQLCLKYSSQPRTLCAVVGQPASELTDLFGLNTLQALIVRTERVADTAKRRVLDGESVPNSDKLFNVFEPHTQL